MGIYLELVLEDVFLGGHLAVEAQQALLLWGEGLDGIVRGWGRLWGNGSVGGWDGRLTLMSTLFC